MDTWLKRQKMEREGDSNLKIGGMLSKMAGGKDVSQKLDLSGGVAAADREVAMVMDENKKRQEREAALDGPGSSADEASSAGRGSSRPDSASSVLTEASYDCVRVIWSERPDTSLTLTLTLTLTLIG